MKTLVTLLLVFLSVLPAFAADVRYYDIEIVIFENRDPIALRSEQWPRALSEEAPETWVELGLPYSGELPADYDPRFTFVPLPEDKYLLNQEVKTLEESEDYRVLMHFGWRQPGMDRQAAIPVRIQRLVPPLTEAPAEEVEAATPQAEPAFVVLEGDEEMLPTPPDSQYMELSGYIRIALARYLHVSTDLVYQPQQQTVSPVPAEGEVLAEDDAAQHVIFHLKQRRRMRSRELHYFDHPVLSALILITPFEPPQAPAARPKG